MDNRDDAKQARPGDPDLIIAGEPHYTRKALAEAFRKSTQTLAGWSVRGYGPRHRLIGKTCVYPLSEVRKFLLETMI
jgi:hypothetical protein